jgi:Fur family zinc uptake transcriptional regulator
MSGSLDEHSAHGAHDHDHCIADALAAAEALCAQRGIRLTETRRRVLELVWRGHAPVGAYEILEALRTEGRGAQPPTVYRALDFLIEQGLVHRIESRNAFIGCTRHSERHSYQFLICRNCGSVAELTNPRIAEAIEAGAAAEGFATQRSTVEIEGQCAECRRAA